MIFILFALILSQPSLAYLSKTSVVNSPYGDSLEQEQEDKKWSFGFSQGVSRGAYYEAREVFSFGGGVSYQLSQEMSFSVSGSWLYPTGFVADDSLYGFTDIALGGNFHFSKKLLGFRWGSALGFSFPTSQKSQSSGKQGAFHIKLSHFKQSTAFPLSFGFFHTLYVNLYKYKTNPSGISNTLAASSHNVQLTLQKDDFRLTGIGKIYVYTYLADQNPQPHIIDDQLKFKVNQGASLTASYLIWKKHGVTAFFGASINVPVVSFVLTGFPLFRERSWFYNGGLSWSL